MDNLPEGVKIPPEFLAKWPAANLDWREVATLIPYARNARIHTDAQVAAIGASIREFGWTAPVLIDPEGEIIAGHGRILAAPALGIAVVPVLIARGWTDAQKRAYRVADNQLTLASGWDLDLLGPEIEGLRAEGFDLALTGFDDATLADLFRKPQPHGSLAERFGIPPFSVLNAREGWWQDRKRGWLALGIQSELGRGQQANDRGESGSARINDAADMQRSGRAANAIPGGAPMPLDRARQGNANAAPGGSALPAADYRDRQRGDGRGRPIT